jgi:hypothetical protein
MSAHKSQDPATPIASAKTEELQEPKGTGAGAVSALERMKALHALRRVHGPRTAGPGHEEDVTPER